MKAKNVLKALGVAALTASLVPYRVERDRENGTGLFESLLLRVKVRNRSQAEMDLSGLPQKDIQINFLPLLDEEDNFEDFDDGPVLHVVRCAEDAVESAVNSEPVQDAVQMAKDAAHAVLESEPVQKVKEAVGSAVDAESVKETVENIKDAAVDAASAAANEIKDAAVDAASAAANEIKDAGENQDPSILN